MLVSELNIGASLIPFIGAKLVCVDPNNKNYVIVKRQPHFNGSHINIKMHKTLWAFILEYSRGEREEFRKAKYQGISRTMGEPILSYPHGTCTVVLKNGIPRLEIMKSLEDHYSISKNVHIHKCYTPEKSNTNNLLLLL